MKPIAYEMTPQGFRIPMYGGIRRSDEPDDMVVEAHALLSSDPMGRTHSWEFQRKIMNRGLDLFGDFREFLRAQDTSQSLTLHQRKFLEDTLQFIYKGTRSMSLETRALCLNMERDELSPKRFVPHRSLPRLVDLIPVPKEDYMFHWIGQDRGFTDMVCTLNIIFGNTNKNVTGIYPTI